MNVAAGRERLALGHGAGAGGAALPHGGRHRLMGVLVSGRGLHGGGGGQGVGGGEAGGV